MKLFGSGQKNSSVSTYAKTGANYGTKAAGIAFGAWGARDLAQVTKEVAANGLDAYKNFHKGIHHEALRERGVGSEQVSVQDISGNSSSSEEACNGEANSGATSVESKAPMSANKKLALKTAVGMTKILVAFGLFKASNKIGVKKK